MVRIVEAAIKPRDASELDNVFLLSEWAELNSWEHSRIRAVSIAMTRDSNSDGD